MERKPALQAFVEKFVGGNYYTQNSQVTVGTTREQLLPNNMERMAAVLINTGTEELLVAPTNQVTTSNGIILGDGGGSLSLQANEDLVLVGYSWFGIVAANTTTVTVIEVIRYKETGE